MAKNDLTNVTVGAGINVADTYANTKITTTQILLTDKQKKEALDPKNNFMVIKLSWSANLVVPWDEGVIIMGALKNAELLVDYHSEDAKITPVTKNDAISSEILSQEEYLKLKMAHILNVKIGDFDG